jgi:hypothetical protein
MKHFLFCLSWIWLVAGIWAVEDPKTQVDLLLNQLHSKDRLKRIDAIQAIGKLNLPETRKILLDYFTSNLHAKSGYEEWITHEPEQADGTSVYHLHQSENEALSHVLAESGCVEALSSIKAALAYEMKKLQTEIQPAACQQYASDIYDLSAECVNYYYSNKIVKYEPSPIQEERARLRLRPDLVPAHGLTAELQISQPGWNHYDLYGSEPLEIKLRLINHTNQTIP